MEFNISFLPFMSLSNQTQRYLNHILNNAQAQAYTISYFLNNRKLRTQQLSNLTYAQAGYIS